MSKPLEFIEKPAQEMLATSESFMSTLQRRRTVRDFSARAVDPKIIENAVRAAVSAPSGANKQPWHFVIVQDAKVKREIRRAAEIEEYEFYHGRAPQSWLDDLKVFDTDEHKPFLETAPFLVAVFLQRNSVDDEGNKQKNYYMPESVGIATGMLISALHFSGLATLTHTPSPMKFLNQILDRPANEKPYMLIVAGYPEVDATVPDIRRKPFNEVCSRF
ncbi:oxidoreductase [Arenicella chitinivorans]|uniref:Oxidoreductase n=1 Tax=Arenicella chitinivorans TaxID=1329800 RepID=A0A918RNN6_9GAMM|nr:nitroreductase family protein [Arenicella chitinivorans]GHA04289.1 oxidoreductase [Arenicella chitinivorans]